MEHYAYILLFAIPSFLLLIIIEWTYGYVIGQNTFRSFDTISSLSSGMTNIIKDVLKLSVVIISYQWLYDHFALISFDAPWFLYLVAFIGLDFAGYWSHRLEHVINIFWNRHIIHHSSEEYNLACALRQQISEVFKIFVIFLLPCALLGVPTKVIAIIGPIHLFAQFWYHTKLINKMGFLEKIIVTPSHHRVHHAINDIYLDKNFSQIFIIWDKLFGTFQEELESEPPVFGVKKAVRTWNPFYINFQHIYLLIMDAIRTKKMTDKLKIWFMPNGWRPKDVAERYPIQIIEQPQSYIKYDKSGTMILHVWSWIHFSLIFIVLMTFFYKISSFETEELFLIAGFIFLSIFALTALMDGDKLSFLAESTRVVLIGLSFFTNYMWFDIFSPIILLVCSLSLLACLYFLTNKPKREIHSLEKV